MCQIISELSTHRLGEIFRVMMGRLKDYKAALCSCELEFCQGSQRSPTIHTGESDPSDFQHVPEKRASARRAAKALLQAVGLVLRLCEHPRSLVSHQPAKLFFLGIFKRYWNQPGPGRGCKREDMSNHWTTSAARKRGERGGCAAHYIS